MYVGRFRRRHDAGGAISSFVNAIRCRYIVQIAKILNLL